MNERIKQLANEAGLPTYNPEGIPTKLEKFAELIVRECIDIAQDRANFPGYSPNDVNDIIDEIKQHFGVEQ